MDIAIVTGAGSGLGLAITRKLIELGLRVYGFGGQYDESSFSHEYFVPMPCNLADMDEVRSKVDDIIRREGDNIYILVNNAKLYHSKGIVEISDAEIEAVLNVNLLCPIVLVRKALPSLTRLGGFVINIVANTAENSKGGAIGAATAGGLRWMGEALFEQLREDGVKVCSVFPQVNKWRPDGSAPARQRPQSAIDTDAVAEAVASIVQNRYGNVVTDVVIRPQRLAEKPVPAPFVVPYPKPQPLPKTAPREVEAHVSLSETRAEMRREGELVRKLLERADAAPDEDDVPTEKSEAPAPSYEKIAEERHDGEDAPAEEDDADERDIEDRDDRPFREADDSEEDVSDEKEEAVPESDERALQAENQGRQPIDTPSDDLQRNGRHRRGRRGGRNRRGDDRRDPATEQARADEPKPSKEPQGSMNPPPEGLRPETPAPVAREHALPKNKDEQFERETRPVRRENEQNRNGRNPDDNDDRQEKRDQPPKPQAPKPAQAPVKPASPAPSQLAQAPQNSSEIQARRHNRRNRRPGSIMPVVASDGTISRPYAASIVRDLPVAPPRHFAPPPRPAKAAIPVSGSASAAPAAPARVTQPAREEPKPAAPEAPRKEPMPVSTAPVSSQTKMPPDQPESAAALEKASVAEPKRARKPRPTKIGEGATPVKRARKPSSRAKKTEVAKAPSSPVETPVAPPSAAEKPAE